MIPAHHVPDKPEADHHVIGIGKDDVLATLPKVDKGKGRAQDLDLDIEAAQDHGLGRRIIDTQGDELYYRSFRSESEDLKGIMELVEQELSEPPHLAFLVFPRPQLSKPIATIICKQDGHRGRNRGYIAMLSVDKDWRRRGIASKLVELAIEEMIKYGAEEVVLETEYDNAPSLALYDRMGFLREKRLHRFYSNGKDAFRLILPLETDPPESDYRSQHFGRGGDRLGLDIIHEEGRDTPRPLAKGLPEAYEGMYI